VINKIADFSINSLIRRIIIYKIIVNVLLCVSATQGWNMKLFACTPIVRLNNPNNINPFSSYFSYGSTELHLNKQCVYNLKFDQNIISSILVDHITVENVNFLQLRFNCIFIDCSPIMEYLV
jgi:hypothetical protein